MALVMNVEKRIWDIEQFAVTIRGQDGRDVRGDKAGMRMYPFQNKAKNAMTVGDWKSRRFEPTYQGFGVDVLDGTGQPVPGNTLLATVRDSYEED